MDPRTHKHPACPWQRPKVKSQSGACGKRGFDVLIPNSPTPGVLYKSALGQLS